MRETDKDLDSVEYLDWSKIQAKFMENTDPNGAHPIDDDLLSIYLKSIELLFNSVKKILFELKSKKSSVVSKDDLIFLAGCTLGRALRESSNGPVYPFISGIIGHLRISFSKNAIWWEKDIPSNLARDFVTSSLTLEELLNNCPQLLAGLFTTFAFEEV